MAVTFINGYLFFTVDLTFLYGRKYSSVYPATNHINPASRLAMIHFSNVPIFTPSCVLWFSNEDYSGPLYTWRRFAKRLRNWIYRFENER